ncbi:MAG: 5'/3'-nucleotidase SurE [Candidatus Heimdallarchaeota archaeon]|nr:5'/3'-nucleotidase SurE [Candidatus Heimdallarchaeota archaeon]
MNANKKKILLTNDDGIKSMGLLSLYDELSKFADVTVISPHIQRSGEGKAITFNKILRLEEEVLKNGVKGYTISGTSADAIIFAVNSLKEGPFDFVVAGINQGLNISSHIVLSSGTCAAAFEGAFYGLRSIAFSMDTSSEHYFGRPHKETFKVPAKIAGRFVKSLLEKSYPKGLAFPNVNFPQDVQLDSPIKMTTLAPRLIDFKPEKRKDPRNKDYYFIWGEITEAIPKGSDVREILAGNISVTPICLDFTFSTSSTKNFLQKIITKIEKTK